jgi:dinuclear metal center YbgI/SA1388 family protein
MLSMAKKRSQVVTVGEIAAAMDRIAPPSLAQSWDNVGLLIGDRAAECYRVFLCIDLTPAVLDEAIAKQCSMVVAYHPLIFRPISRLLADSGGTEAIAHKAIAHGIAVYSPHTALDAAPGGTNDVLAGLCGLKEVEPFEYIGSELEEYKLVTFVPIEHLDSVSAALFAAGAGRIGEYEQCSYRLAGEGTFFGTESTNPQWGRRGRLEKVAEIRIEMVVSAKVLPEAVAALRNSHPYEEPAFDVYPLVDEPKTGIGRVGSLPRATTLGKLASSLKKVTGSRVATIVGAPGTRVRRAAVCVGAAGRLPLEKPRSRDCDVIITGEIRHHDALTILRRHLTAIALGHWESERPMLRPLAGRLAADVLGIETVIGRKDAGPFRSV